jgi:hypothetical protein
MRRRTALPLAVAITVVAAACHPGPNWFRGSLAAGLAEADKHETLLMVDFTADW